MPYKNHPIHPFPLSLHFCKNIFVYKSAQKADPDTVKLDMALPRYQKFILSLLFSDY